MHRHLRVNDILGAQGVRMQPKYHEGCILGAQEVRKQATNQQSHGRGPLRKLLKKKRDVAYLRREISR